MKTSRFAVASAAWLAAAWLGGCGMTTTAPFGAPPSASEPTSSGLLAEGQRVFRFDTCGTDVVTHYNRVRALATSARRQRNLVEYLKSL